jgi:hypothetical protein
MCYLQIKFHTSSSSGPLVIAIEPKADEIFPAAAILLIYVL